MIVRADLRRHMATTAADVAGLDPCVVAAFCEVESSWRADATRYEHGYRYLWDVRAWQPFRKLSREEAMAEMPPADFAALGDIQPWVEWKLQKTSLGLMQVMGAVAREQGFRGADLDALLSPDIGLEFACRKLASVCRRWPTLEEQAAAYNAGTPRRNEEGEFVNQGYVDKIVAAVERYEREWSA